MGKRQRESEFQGLRDDEVRRRARDKSLPRQERRRYQRGYHCEPAVAHSSPWTREEQLQHTFGGISSTLRLLALHEATGSEQALDELRRLVNEALAALPDEERRLERIASGPAAELPALMHALQAG